MIIREFRLLSLALQIAHDRQHRADLARALRILENLKPNVTQEKTTDENAAQKPVD